MHVWHLFVSKWLQPPCHHLRHAKSPLRVHGGLWPPPLRIRICQIHAPKWHDCIKISGLHALNRQSAAAATRPQPCCLHAPTSILPGKSCPAADPGGRTAFCSAQPHRIHFPQNTQQHGHMWQLKLLLNQGLQLQGHHVPFLAGRSIRTCSAIRQREDAAKCHALIDDRLAHTDPYAPSKHLLQSTGTVAERRRGGASGGPMAAAHGAARENTLDKAARLSTSKPNTAWADQAVPPDRNFSRAHHNSKAASKFIKLARQARMLLYGSSSTDDAHRMRGFYHGNVREQQWGPGLLDICIPGNFKASVAAFQPAGMQGPWPSILEEMLSVMAAPAFALSDDMLQHACELLRAFPREAFRSQLTYQETANHLLLCASGTKGAGSLSSRHVILYGRQDASALVAGLVLSHLTSRLKHAPLPYPGMLVESLYTMVYVLGTSDAAEMLGSRCVAAAQTHLQRSNTHLSPKHAHMARAVSMLAAVRPSGRMEDALAAVQQLYLPAWDLCPAVSVALHTSGSGHQQHASPPLSSRHVAAVIDRGFSDGGSVSTQKRIGSETGLTSHPSSTSQPNGDATPGSQIQGEESVQPVQRLPWPAYLPWLPALVPEALLDAEARQYHLQASAAFWAAPEVQARLHRALSFCISSSNAAQQQEDSGMAINSCLQWPVKAWQPGDVIAAAVAVSHLCCYQQQLGDSRLCALRQATTPAPFEAPAAAPHKDAGEVVAEGGASAWVSAGVGSGSQLVVAPAPALLPRDLPVQQEDPAGCSSTGNAGSVDVCSCQQALLNQVHGLVELYQQHFSAEQLAQLVLVLRQLPPHQAVAISADLHADLGQLPLPVLLVVALQLECPPQLPLLKELEARVAPAAGMQDTEPCTSIRNALAAAAASVYERLLARALASQKQLDEHAEDGHAVDGVAAQQVPGQQLQELQEAARLLVPLLGRLDPPSLISLMRCVCSANALDIDSTSSSTTGGNRHGTPHYCAWILSTTANQRAQLAEAALALLLPAVTDLRPQHAVALAAAVAAGPASSISLPSTSSQSMEPLSLDPCKEWSAEEKQLYDAMRSKRNWVKKQQQKAERRKQLRQALASRLCESVRHRQSEHTAAQLGSCLVSLAVSRCCPDDALLQLRQCLQIRLDVCSPDEVARLVQALVDAGAAQQGTAGGAGARHAISSSLVHGELLSMAARIISEGAMQLSPSQAAGTLCSLVALGYSSGIVTADWEAAADGEESGGADACARDVYLALCDKLTMPVVPTVHGGHAWQRYQPHQGQQQVTEEHNREHTEDAAGSDGNRFRGGNRSSSCTSGASCSSPPGGDALACVHLLSVTELIRLSKAVTSIGLGDHPVTAAIGNALVVHLAG